MLRELNKACAGFQGANEAMQKEVATVATGNWGCGVFQGFVELKAVLQWLAASEDGISLRYFPFDAPFGPRLTECTQTLVDRQVTVGQLWRGLVFTSRQAQINEAPWARPGHFLEGLQQVVLKDPVGHH